MARPLRIEYPGCFYHVTARGNERQDIYKSVRDREKFLSYLESATQRYSAVIHAYCLMTNHYHLLVETPQGNLSKIMQQINGSYTAYFNVKRKRSGHLFQGRYKAIIVEADSYACELSRYIHLNPVRVGMAKAPEEYRWSSYQDYIDARQQAGWLTTSFILDYFPLQQRRSAYRQFVEEKVGKEYPSPLLAAVASTVLGGEEFIAEIIDRKILAKAWDREVPATRTLKSTVSPEEVLGKVTDYMQGQKEARKVAIFICHRHTGLKLSEIARCFQLSLSGVTQVSKRFGQDLQQDPMLAEKVESIRSNLNLCNV